MTEPTVVEKGNTSKDMKWRKEYFDQQWQFIKKFEESVNKYNEQSQPFTKQESAFSRSIGDRFSGLSEQCRFPQINTFFEDMAGIFTGYAIHRKDVLSTMSKSVSSTAKEVEKDAGDASNQFTEYCKTFKAFKTARKKMDGLQAELLKAENETRKQNSIKGKKKKKELEKKKLEAVEKEFVNFEKIQKFATFIEERAKNEFDYQLEKGNSDFMKPIFESICKYQDFHEKMNNRLKQMIKRYSIREKLEKFQPAKRKADIKIKTVSEEFLPISQKRIFGVDIELVMTRPHEVELIPHYVNMMIECIDKNNEHVGIFRLPGNKEAVEYMKRHMDNCKLDKLNEDSKNINNVASLLKEYFRDLPATFAPVTYFEPLERLTSEKEKVDFLRTNAVKKLSPANHQTFYRLFKMFHEITLKQEINKMNHVNLAVCWAMNIFQIPAGINPMEVMKLNTAAGKIFSFILEHFKEIWPGGKAPKPPKYKKKKFAMSKTELKEMGKKVLKKKKEMVDGDVGEEEEEEEILEEFQVLEKNIIRNDCPVTQVISMDKKWIVSGDEKGVIKIYPLEKFGVDPMAKIVYRGEKGHKKAITCLEKVEAGKFATGSMDGTVIFWTIGSATNDGVIHPLQDRPDESNVIPVSKLVILKKAKMLLVACGRYLCGVSLLQKRICCTYDAFESEIRGVVEAPTGQFYVTTKKDGKLFEFSANAMTKTPKVIIIGDDTPDNMITNVVCSRKKKKILVGCITGKYALFEDITKLGQKPPMIVDTRKKREIVHCVELNRKRDFFALVFPYADGDEVSIAIGAAGIVKKAKLAGHILGLEKWRGKEKVEANWFFFWTSKNEICIYNQDKKVKAFTGHSGKINRVANFLGTKYFVSCSDDKTIRLWDCYAE